MTGWVDGTWADVRLGDQVFGGDGYPWTVVLRERQVTLRRQGRNDFTFVPEPGSKVRYRPAMEVRAPPVTGDPASDVAIRTLAKVFQVEVLGVEIELRELAA